MEWDCGTKTMEESVTSIYIREAAAVKRERTMAYAFSHQVTQHDQLISLAL